MQYIAHLNRLRSTLHPLPGIREFCLYDSAPGELICDDDGDLRLA
jgi:hypothetical protein